VAGAFRVERAETIVASIMFSLQHRGQESCGVAARFADGNIHGYRGMGLVKNVLTHEVLDGLESQTAIGHVRYPTAGSCNTINSQPHVIELAQGAQMAICSNGDVINYWQLRRGLEHDHGFVFKSDNDGELIGRLIAFHAIVERRPIEEAIAAAQEELHGAFSALLLFRERMYVFRDPHGIRPLVMGHLSATGTEVPSEGAVFASESCGFGIVGAREIRPVNPGEILRLAPGKPVETVSVNARGRQHCIFELIYFSRPDSRVFGENVYASRKRIGATLADYDEEIALGDDLVVLAVPDSSNFVALGYAERKGARFDMGLLRNHYVGRTFLRPQQQARDESVKEKFNPLPGFFPGKRVVMVDDSIVRGTTVRKIVRMVRGAGAREVHLRIGSPKVIGPCHYGIDTPTREELIANRMSEAEIAEYIGVDSLKYLRVPDLQAAAATRPVTDFCRACFTNEYVFPPENYGL
jgi:amidophosphoribosyltransferase